MQRDAEILASLPGLGRINLATLLAETWEALRRRAYSALRSLTGVAPVTRSSGKSHLVVRRLACHPRLANAMYHWA
ncbi:transposase, partial [Acinetobacter baumannii]